MMVDGLKEFETAMELFTNDFTSPLTGEHRSIAQELIVTNHYTSSIPSGKSHYFHWRGVLVVFSIPANMNISKFVLGRPCVCWELSRLWAPDGHRRNALTEAMAQTISGLKAIEKAVEVLVSFADPNVGHEGTVYKAASWIYTGQSEEGRGYRDVEGRFYPRRSFHSGNGSLTKAEIESRGFVEIKRDGKHRFVKGLTRRAKHDIERRWNAKNDDGA